MRQAKAPAKRTTMPTVFLSYRRSETQGEAGRLADALQARLGRKSVFRDVVSISPGERFDSALESELAATEIAVVLIGPNWLEDLRTRLLQRGSDFHRLEIATALKRGKRVIPVLLRDATLPKKEDLPEDLQELIKCQALTIKDESWKTDVDRLIAAIGRSYRWGPAVLRMSAAVIVIILIVWKLVPPIFPGLASDYAFWRGLVLGLIGAYGLLELMIWFRHHKISKRLRAKPNDYQEPGRS
jgi:hypothetical protein